MKEILSMSELLSSGKKIAFVKGNRNINTNNVSSKFTSLTTFGGNIIPIMYVQGEKAIADGCRLVDIEGNDVAENDAKDYIVIVDGQHRTEAAIRNDFDLSKIFVFENYLPIETKQLLAEANIESVSWKPVDYISGADLFSPSELTKFAKDLTDKGFTPSTISKIGCFNSSLSKKTYASIMKGDKVEIDYDLERAETFLNAASKFENSFVAKRYLIDEVISLSTKEGYKVVCEALEQFTPKEVKNICEVKRSEVSQIIKNTFAKYLVA